MSGYINIHLSTRGLVGPPSLRGQGCARAEPVRPVSLPPHRPVRPTAWSPPTASTRASGTAVRDASGTGNNGSDLGHDVERRRAGSAPRCRSTAPTRSVTVPDSNSLDLTHRHDARGVGEPDAPPAAPGAPSIFKQTAAAWPTRCTRNNGASRPTGQVNILGEQNATGTARGAARTRGRTSPRPMTARPCACTSTARRSASKPQTGSIPASTGAAADRRQLDLGRVVPRADRRGADLLARAHRRRDPDRHDDADRRHAPRPTRRRRPCSSPPRRPVR